MKFTFECDNAKEYVVEAESFAEAQTRFSTMGWKGEIPKVLFYRASVGVGLPSALKLSMVA